MNINPIMGEFTPRALLYEPPASSWPHVIPRPEVRMVVLFLALVGSWVSVTDFAVLLVFPNRPVYAQTLKSLNLIATSSLLLYIVLRRAYRGWRKAEREQWKLVSEISDGFRSLSAHAQSQRENERTRISRELHDQIGQALTGLSLDLRWVETQLELRDDRTLNPLTDRLVEAQERVASTIATVQRIATDLRPNALDDLGLVEALQEEAELFTRRTGLRCEVKERDVPHHLPTEVATAAFRIVQEALTNVIRHAEASRVEVVCELADDWLKVCVIDDGKGISKASLLSGKSLGLLGMRERAEILGGFFSIAAGESGGTTVTAYLPWQKPTSES